MGAVWRARHGDDGRIAALKCVVQPSRDAIRALRREIAALARLDHPGLVRMLDQGLADGMPWYAMELVPGEPLLGWWDRRQGSTGPGGPTLPQGTGQFASSADRTWTDELPEPVDGPTLGEPSAVAPAARGHLPEALTVLARLCEPLAWLHGEGLTHRDLKPDNVLVDAAGAPRLVDFGLALAFAGAGGREVLDGELAGGTPSYMAPEQIRGGTVDARADLYALGCLLHELVVGRPPFVAATTSALLHQHLHTAPTPLSAQVDGVPPALDVLAARLLEKQPEKRVGHALAVRSALVRILSELGAPEPPPLVGAPRTYLYAPRFLGRVPERAALRQALQAASDGNGGVVLVSGRSGAGKTRLVAGALASARSTGALVLVGGCEPPTRRDAAGRAVLDAAPLSALVAPLSALATEARVRGPAWASTVLGPHQGVLATVAPELAEIPGLPRPAEPPAVSPEEGRERLLVALVDAFAGLATRDVALLALDDLQWADELTLAFLRRVADRPGRLVVLATSRAEEHTAGLSALEPHLRLHLELGPLPEADLRALAAQMLALPWIDRGLGDTLVARAEGNPYFVSELLRLAVVEGRLALDEDGAWVSRAERWSDLPLPDALSDVILRRLATLSPSASELLGWCATFGRTFDGDDLGAVCDGWEAPLAELVAAHVVEERGAYAWAFSHDRILEAAAGGVPAERAPELHRAVAGVLAARPDAEPATLAPHWAAAGELDRARVAFYAAARRAVARHALDDAERHFRAGLALAEVDDDVDLSARLTYLTSVVSRQGRRAEAIAEYERLLEACRARFPDRVADVALGLAGEASRQGRNRDALAWADVALAATDDPAKRSEALVRRVHDLALAHRAGEAAEALAEARAEAERAPRDKPGAMRLASAEARVLMVQERFAESREAWTRVLELARELNVHGSELAALSNLVFTSGWMGDNAAAERWCHEEIELGRRTGDVEATRHGRHNLGSVYGQLRRTGEALAMWRENLALVREQGLRPYEGETLFALGMHTDDLASSEAWLAAAERVFAEIDDPRRAHVVVRLVRARRHLGWAPAALEADLRAALAALEAQGAARMVAMAWCELGFLELAQGRSVEATLAEAARRCEGQPPIMACWVWLAELREAARISSG